MCENRRLAIYLQLPQGEAIQEFSCENRNKTTAKRLDINPGPGGGLLKYDLGSGRATETLKVDPFLYQILPKNETHFYTRTANLSKIYYKFHIVFQNC